MGHLACLPLTAALLALAPAPATRAAESEASCTTTISSLPATVNSSGTWCLTQNLTTSIATGSAIEFTAHNAVLDCNGFGIDGSAAGLGTEADGIYASAKNNVTIRNCRVRGFRYGINGGGAYASGPYYVENNVVEGNTTGGIRLLAYGTVIRGNRVLGTGGSTVNANAEAITASYAGDISDNTVVDVVATTGGNGNARGIRATGYLESTNINGNRVRGVVADGTGNAVGIYADQGNGVVIRDNDVVGSTGTALTCTGPRARARNNVVSGFPTALSGCVNAGGNVIKP